MPASALLATLVQLELVCPSCCWCSDSKMELVAGLLAAAGGWCGDTGTGSVHLLLGAGHRWTLLCWRNESAGNTEAGGNYCTDAGTLTR